jgi:hypothetical protein
MKIRVEATQKLFTFVDVEVPDEIVKDNDWAYASIAAWIDENMDYFDWKDQDSDFNWDTWERL